MTKESMEKTKARAQATAEFGSKDSRTSKATEIMDDTIGGSSAGGRAGTGGVSTNSVGASKTSKNPLVER